VNAVEGGDALAITAAAIAVAATLMLAPSAAWAGSPHFVSCSVERTDDSLVVSGKEAGLGDEATIEIKITAVALCINPGGHHPKADNKQSLADDFPVTVQNGKADFSDTLTASFQPSCSPPDTIEFTNVSVCHLTNHICCPIAGTF